MAPPSTRARRFPGWTTRPDLQPSTSSAPGCPPAQTMAQFALRWILMNDAVTCAIPGGRRPAQVDENMRAADLPPLSPTPWQRSPISTRALHATRCTTAGESLERLTQGLTRRRFGQEQAVVNVRSGSSAVGFAAVSKSSAFKLCAAFVYSASRRTAASALS